MGSRWEGRLISPILHIVRGGVYHVTMYASKIRFRYLL